MYVYLRYEVLNFTAPFAVGALHMYNPGYIQENMLLHHDLLCAYVVDLTDIIASHFFLMHTVVRQNTKQFICFTAVQINKYEELEQNNMRAK